ncbi:MAG: bifunctional folylpolyglutamate synthase/dihydrofolate synthase [bacterium]
MPKTLSDWLSLLEARHPTSIELGLDRVSRVFEQLHPEALASTVITVAGTNGKGSCVAILERLFRRSGKSVATYTSPHLIHFHERVSLDGQHPSDMEFCTAFEAVEQARLSSAPEVSLTYFEFTTLAAFLLISNAKPDVAILEIGLGGRLDAVNIIDPDIAIITSVALDHQGWLGDNLDDIGREKAGIARRGKPLIYGDAEPVGSVIDVGREVGAKVFQNGVDFRLEGSDFSTCLLDESNISLDNATTAILPAQSLACAVQAFCIAGPLVGIPLSGEFIDQAIGEVLLPGRFQRLRFRGRNFVVDVAHNPAAAALLGNNLRRCYPDRTIAAVFGAMQDKDIPGIVDDLQHSLGKQVARWYLPCLDGSGRAAEPSNITALMYNSRVCETVAAAMDQAIVESAPNDVILVFGSFLIVGPALQYLGAIDDWQ